jgi:hypothetical protein
MPIQFACSCGRKLRAQDEHAGRRIQCPSCGAEMTVPAGEDAVQTAKSDRPKSSPVQAEPRRPRDEEADEDRPRRRAHEDDDEDARPRRRARDDDEDDRPVVATETSGKATAAFILGLLSFCLNLLAAVPAILLGVLSLRDINRSRGRLGGQGLAVTGLILGCLGIIVSTGVGFVTYRAYVATKQMVEDIGEQIGDAGDRMFVSNNMKEMTLALIEDADRHQGNMAAPAICDKAGKPLLSWRVTILPYLGQGPLHQQFKLDEPWDSPNNIRLLNQMPSVYAHPRDPDGAVRGNTYYRVFTGPHTAFPDPAPPFPRDHSSLRFPAAFTDGTANCILIVEAGEAVPWTKPDELPYDPNKPLPKLGGRFGKGYCVGMADGSVKFITPKVSEHTLRTAITIDDGIPLGPDWALP